MVIYDCAQLSTVWRSEVECMRCDTVFRATAAPEQATQELFVCILMLANLILLFLMGTMMVC